MNKIATFTNDNMDFKIYENQGSYEIETVVWDDDRTEIESCTTMYLKYDQLKKFSKEICFLKEYLKEWMIDTSVKKYSEFVDFERSENELHDLLTKYPYDKSTWKIRK